MTLKKAIENEIIEFVCCQDKLSLPEYKWRTPLIKYADAEHSDFQMLKKIVHPDHELPCDVLSDARIVIAYFVPFSEAIAKGNASEGLASADWAQVYEVTNAMISRLNKHIIAFLKERGYSAAVSKEASVFDRENIISRWSQRHIAKIAGLGNFGLNNMLITESGCCGRISTIVTNLDIEPDSPEAREYCLFKRNGACGLCVKKCGSGALTEEYYDRRKCYLQCLENAKIYTQFGSSYASKAGEKAGGSGSEVCGKCLVDLPCTYKKP